MKPFILVLIFIALIMPYYSIGAEAPGNSREQLKQMVEQLQKNPADNALREKIIKLALTIKPAPAVPEEAEKFEGRAQFAFKNAKSPADYLDAAREYEKAVTVAPWVPGYYADLCTIYEKAEKYEDAKRSCKLYLASNPPDTEASVTRKRISGLEFAIEKENSPEVRAERQKLREEAFFRSMDGARFVHVRSYPGASIELVFEIRGRVMIETHRLQSIDRRQWTAIEDMTSPGQTREHYRLMWRNGAFVYSDKSGGYVVSPDGKSLSAFDYEAVTDLHENFAVRQ